MILLKFEIFYIINIEKLCIFLEKIFSECSNYWLNYVTKTNDNHFVFIIPFWLLKIFQIYFKILKYFSFIIHIFCKKCESIKEKLFWNITSMVNNNKTTVVNLIEQEFSLFFWWFESVN
jgi:hypothetical protein